MGTLWSRKISCMLFVGLMAISTSDRVLGQTVRRAVSRYQSSVNEPYVSPYLNLARPGADPGFNYSTLVQPQIVQQRNTELNAARIQGLNRDLQMQQTKVGPYGPLGGMRATGRGASYRNYSHYYPSLAGPGGKGGAPRNYPAPLGTGSSAMNGTGFGMF
ncbi:MAG TPA: hypothetical protein VHC22_17935 [Pirellulales bacterium]|nr:hypothetical protein [Pirellulales bacterium]